MRRSMMRYVSRPVIKRVLSRSFVALSVLFAVACAPVLAGEARLVAGAGAPRVIDLVQTDHAFSPKRLSLPPGRYVFRVKNAGVDHPVGFRLARLDGDGAVGEPLPAAALQAPLPEGAVG